MSGTCGGGEGGGGGCCGSNDGGGGGGAGAAPASPCGNKSCKCPTCECGSTCTCGVTPRVVCDPCNAFAAGKKKQPAPPGSVGGGGAVSATNPCGNKACKCPTCECGSRCTCGVSPDVVCDPCKAFVAGKKKQEAPQGSVGGGGAVTATNPCSNKACKCPTCECGSRCTCGVSPDVVCDPCKAFVAAKKIQQDRQQQAAGARAARTSPCGNNSCKCPTCECGSRCTCGVSLDAVRDLCKAFVAGTPQQHGGVFAGINPCGNKSCKCPSCQCGTACTCGISADVLCEPCKAYPAAVARKYGRQLLVPGVGAPAQGRLAQARVLVVGAGGLGSPLILYLAGAGVGRIGVVDADCVEESNLHRQIIHTEASAGAAGVGPAMLKAASARDAALRLNGSIQCAAIPVRFAAANAEELVSDYDIVVDCTDNAASRYLISDACFLYGRALVSGAAIGMDGQLTVLNTAGRTVVTTAGGRARRAATGGNGPGACYRCIYPRPPAGAQDTCALNGVLGPVPGVIGTLMAVEVLKLAGGFGESVAGQLKLYDATDGSFMSVRLPDGPVAACALCGTDPSIKTMAESAAWLRLHGLASDACSASGSAVDGGGDDDDGGGGFAEMTVRELWHHRQQPPVGRAQLLVDVRHPAEVAISLLPGAVSVPLDRLGLQGAPYTPAAAAAVEAALVPLIRQAAATAVHGAVDVMMLCRSGNRSGEAARALAAFLGDRGARLELGKVSVFNIAGGMLAWAAEVDPQTPVA